MPRLLPCPKPLLGEATTRAAGKFDSTSSRVPSLDSLSTTTTSSAAPPAWAKIVERHGFSQRASLVDTTTIARSATICRLAGRGGSAYAIATPFVDPPLRLDVGISDTSPTQRIGAARAFVQPLAHAPSLAPHRPPDALHVARRRAETAVGQRRHRPTPDQRLAAPLAQRRHARLDAQRVLVTRRIDLQLHRQRKHLAGP